MDPLVLALTSAVAMLGVCCACIQLRLVDSARMCAHSSSSSMQACENSLASRISREISHVGITCCSVAHRCPTRPIWQMMLEKSLTSTENFAVVVAEHQTLGTFVLQVM